ncbi:LysR family transcriptional regulator [uncultured Sphingomonas sp.]|uniref:LysR family transcriptional regulator n=1 Tax=uncultured Sphingomonas sp. TaxID=158754 RepID=UPI0025E90EAA|nr:LysR family transcriptional regulator [uncultured Sphingomonas sp.]
MTAPDQSADMQVGVKAPPKGDMVQRLNLNLLYPLDAILHAPTLTEAGRRVSLGQSTMSHALRKLRAHFGDNLVLMTGGEWQLTALGLTLRDDVRRVLREVENTLSLSREFDPATTTEAITVAATETTEQMLLGRLILNSSKSAPGLTVNIMPVDHQNPRRSLDQGADILIVAEDMAIDQMETMPILTDHVACMIWQEHPRLRDCWEISEEQYRNGRHIVSGNEKTDAVALDRSGLEMLRNRRICVRTTSFATVPAFVVGTDLIATGSSWLFQSYAASMPLKVIPAPFAERENTIVAQWPRHRNKPLLTWFLAQIRALPLRHTRY